MDLIFKNDLKIYSQWNKASDYFKIWKKKKNIRILDKLNNSKNKKKLKNCKKNYKLM